ncbi:DEAD/DEAH box helicase [Acidovorax sp.]|uniref:DEAD/DEAH box helicase n=1 Tax=Acidovorax sp. TaxID=1872122 RepID=UPI00391F1EB3
MMAMRQLEYQTKALQQLDRYVLALAQQKVKADKISAANAVETDPDLIRPVPDFTEKAWEALRADGWLPASRVGLPFTSRKDGVGRPVPNVVLKVPTGGGKTFLGVQSLVPIFARYLSKVTGLVLWVVPNEAIYAQTKAQFLNRQHPNRQTLDLISGNAVRILEKDDVLDARDVESHLCLMLLMLQSSNRENKESLKMFRDRGDVRGFFPPEGDQEAHAVALKATPNMDIYDLAGSSYPWPQVKDSLGNALRLIRPVVVLDEGHKAMSALAVSTLYGFNPCFVLELTATPKDVAAKTGKNPLPALYAPVLVEVSGKDLDREGMIKMPLNLDPRQGADWHATLAAAVERIRSLDQTASSFQAESGRYIRPILLVQVQRTGSDQRDGEHIHALDVKEWLLSTAGFEEPEIAVKTADTNDLSANENQDLMSPMNRVRVIITKQALQEGWDCPFAYVLCALSASSNLSAMTQLIGRILRQPQASRTGIAALDECYVITHHGETSEVVAAIKSGLESDGMGDLVQEVKLSNGSNSPGARKVNRRPSFAKAEIFLPQVLRVADGVQRPLDYEEDVLFSVDWAGLEVAPFVAKIPDNASGAERQMRRISLADSGDQRIVDEVTGFNDERLRFDVTYAVRMIGDVVSNPWIGRDIVGAVRDGLTERGFTEAKLGSIASLVVEELRAWLVEQRDIKAEALFRAEVAAGRIQFRLRSDGRNWRMPMEAETYEPEGAEQLAGKDGLPLTKSIFSPVYKGDFSNPDERDIAVYLDGEAALRWWHRNVARSNFHVQGWKRERIYPDFIFAVQHDSKDDRYVVLEMKGDHLKGNDDTRYKQAVLQLMSNAYKVENVARVGELELVGQSGGVEVDCDLVLFKEWKTKLPPKLQIQS